MSESKKEEVKLDMSTIESKELQTKPDCRDMAVQNSPDCEEVAVQTCGEIATVESTGRQSTMLLSILLRASSRHINKASTLFAPIVQGIVRQALIVKLSPKIVSTCIPILLQTPFVERRSWEKQTSEF